MTIFNILLRRFDFNELKNIRQASGANFRFWNRRIFCSQPNRGDASAGGLFTPVSPSPFVLVFQSSMQSLSLTLSAIPHGTIRPSDVRYGCEHWLITPKPPLSSLLLEVYSISILGKWASLWQCALTATCCEESRGFCLSWYWQFLSAKLNFKIKIQKSTAEYRCFHGNESWNYGIR